MVWGEKAVKKTFAISSLNDVDLTTTAIKTPVVKSKFCPHCGYDFNQFVNTGFLGCSQCYQAFRTELESYLNEFR